MSSEAASAKQIEFAEQAARVLGVEVGAEFERLGLQRDRRGYGLLIEWMMWAIKRRSYIEGTEIPRVKAAA